MTTLWEMTADSGRDLNGNKNFGIWIGATLRGRTFSVLAIYLVYFDTEIRNFFDIMMANHYDPCSGCRVL